MTPLLHGRLVTLRPSTMEDRRAIYEWGCQSDVTASMMGAPTFPDHPVPTWEEFCDDHRPHFFDGSAPELGRCFIIEAQGEAVGQLYYNDIQTHHGCRATELDMWMRAERFCGLGYGSDALVTLCNYLARELGVQEVMMQPSARNRRAIRAYEKIGFSPAVLSPDEGQARWGASDYHDSVRLVMDLRVGHSARSTDDGAMRETRRAGAQLAANPNATKTPTLDA